MLPTYHCKVTFSIVVYRQPLDELKEVVRSLLLYKGEKAIYIVDNSPTDEASALKQMADCIYYEHMPQNLGFGKAHNWAIRKAEQCNHSKIHFVVNPDVTYTEDVVAPMVAYMEEHPEVGEMMPRVYYPDGRIQYLPKLMPTPFLLIKRKLYKLMPRHHGRWMERFEMRSMRADRIYEVGHCSSCFAAFSMEALKFCGGFDERFFLYFEDTDITRRIHRNYRTIYYPFVSVKHDYGNGASKDPKLFFVFLGSLIKFFNKWGWFFDSERRRCNKQFLKQLMLPLLTLLLLISCQSKTTNKAESTFSTRRTEMEAEGQKRLAKARMQLQQNQCSAAKATITKMRTDCYLALTARKQGIVLMDSVELQMARNELAHADSLMQRQSSQQATDNFDEACRKVQFYERKLQYDQATEKK